MRYWLTALIILSHLATSAQSPELTINVIMDPVKADGIRYKIEMKICKPKKMTERGSWFSHDTSTIDFASMKANDIECGEYFDKGTPERISGPEEVLVNKFIFSNQVFAWEEIYVFSISNSSSAAWFPPMYIVMPIKYKSFVTQIDITDIAFESGKVIFLTDLNAWYEGWKLIGRQSLKDMIGVNVDGFPLKEILKKDN